MSKSEKVGGQVRKVWVRKALMSKLGRVEWATMQRLIGNQERAGWTRKTRHCEQVSKIWLASMKGLSEEARKAVRMERATTVNGSGAKTRRLQAASQARAYFAGKRNIGLNGEGRVRQRGRADFLLRRG